MKANIGHNQEGYEIKGNNGIIIGKSKEMDTLFKIIDRFSNFPVSMLITGESGTGKELVAKALHYNGKRSKCPFVAINCAGIPTKLLESELFGHQKGSFTGAYANKQGLFYQANRGTIFLDEIGDMRQDLQAKLLRVLQERKIRPVGSSIELDLDLRVVAATNQNLEELLESGKFREDLYFRLNVASIELPPLRDRKEDIPALVDFFIEKYNRMYSNEGLDIFGVSNESMNSLLEQPWKGNVRELESVIERSMIMKHRGMIGPKELILVGIPLNKHNEGNTLLISYPKPDGDNIVVTNQTNDSCIEDESNSKEWYQKGVLPITPMVLSTFQGAKSYATLMHHLNHNQGAYSIKIGNWMKNPRLLFLTESEAISFFKDINSNGYLELKDKIKNNPFNELVNEPFKFYVRRQILDSFALKGLRSIPHLDSLFYVRCHVGNLYCVTESDVDLMVPKSHDDFRMSLKQEIKNAYSKFQQRI